MPRLADSDVGSDVDLEDVAPPATDSDAKDQLNGELKDNVKHTVTTAGRGEIEDPVSDDSDDDGPSEEEFNVEAIRSHRVVRGTVLYEIKWQGYPEEENTEEPEQNLLPHARQILADYFETIGGKPEGTLKKSKSKQALRRGASTDDSPAPSSKRQKRNGDRKSLAEVAAEETWTPTNENWEPLIDRVETVERDDSDQLLAYILFTNGKKTKVSMDKVYRHCPRPMLKFYESHLKFK